MFAFQNFPSTTESLLTDPGLIHIDSVSALPETFSEDEFGADR